MEITEGNIRVTQVPSVTIGDLALQDCSSIMIKQTILKLLRKIEQQRGELGVLKIQVDGFRKKEARLHAEIAALKLMLEQNNAAKRNA